MNRLKSKKRIALIVSLMLIIGLVWFGVSFARADFNQYTFRGDTYSRDEFIALSQRAEAENFRLACVQVGFSLGKGYMTHCFDSEDGVRAFLDGQS